MKHFLPWIIASILTWSIPALSSDGEPTEAEKDQAARAFRDGQDLSKKGEYRRAAKAFEKAYRLHRHPSALANIGQCYHAVGDYPRAVEAFRKYFESPNPEVPAFNKKAEKTLKELESKVGDLRVGCRPNGCLVTVDDVFRGMTPLHVALLPGEHDVEVATTDEDRKEHYRVTVRAGREHLLEADLTRPDSETASDSPRLRAPFWVLSAATLVAAGGTAVLGGLNLKTIKDFERGGSTDDSLQERGNQLNLATAIAGGVTGALGVTAIILAIVDLTRESHEDDRGQETAVMPLFGLDSAGGVYAGIRFRFH